MTALWFVLVGVMAALSWRHARSQSPVRVGCPETPARTVQLSSVAPERVSEPTHTRLGAAATLATHPAPPGRGAGAHDLDPRGPQHQGVASC